MTVEEKLESAEELIERIRHNSRGPSGPPPVDRGGGGGDNGGMEPRIQRLEDRQDKLYDMLNDMSRTLVRIDERTGAMQRDGVSKLYLWGSLATLGVLLVTSLWAVFTYLVPAIG